MIVWPTADGFLLVTQSTHALLAFQLAEHWGNRRTPRPAPRAEVLAAVLLHDAGWDHWDQHPGWHPGQGPLGFETWPLGQERERLWQETLAHAAQRGRYVEYLVGHHVLHLAETYSPQRHQAFSLQLREHLQRLREQLQKEPRFRQIFTTDQDQVNRHVLRVVDALAIFLLRPPAPWKIPEVPFKDGPGFLTLAPAGPNLWRLHPWPFVGSRLTVRVEARFLPTAHVPTEAWLQLPRVSLGFTLLKLGKAE